MELEERRVYVQKALILQKHGKSRDEMYDYLLAVGFDKAEIAGVLDMNEAKIKRDLLYMQSQISLKAPLQTIGLGVILTLISIYLYYVGFGIVFFIWSPILLLAGVIALLIKLYKRRKYKSAESEF